MPLLPNELATKLSQEIKNNFTDRRHSNSEQLSRVSQAVLASISSEITSRTIHPKYIHLFIHSELQKTGDFTSWIHKDLILDGSRIGRRIADVNLNSLPNQS